MARLVELVRNFFISTILLHAAIERLATITFPTLKTTHYEHPTKNALRPLQSPSVSARRCCSGHGFAPLANGHANRQTERRASCFCQPIGCQIRTIGLQIVILLVLFTTAPSF